MKDNSKPIGKPTCPHCKGDLVSSFGGQVALVSKYSEVSYNVAFIRINIGKEIKDYDLFECLKCGYATLWRVEVEDSL